MQSLHAGPVALSAGGGSFSFDSAPSPLAWTNAMAQKVLQADFDLGLVRLFEGMSQVTPHTLAVTEGETIAFSAGGSGLAPYRTRLTNELGFAGYKGGESEVTLARPVALAETALGVDLQEAVVRIRANTAFLNSLDFYRVDDLNGGIGGLTPGQEGYAEAAATRLYQTTTGGAPSGRQPGRATPRPSSWASNMVTSSPRDLSWKT